MRGVLWCLCLGVCVCVCVQEVYVITGVAAQKDIKKLGGQKDRD